MYEIFAIAIGIMNFNVSLISAADSGWNDCTGQIF